MIPVVQELDRRQWLNKRWITRQGKELGGKSFTKTSLHKLLTNVAYAGKIKYKTEVHNGEHTGIVSPDTWQRLQTIMRRNGVSGGPWSVTNFGSAHGSGALRTMQLCDDANLTPRATAKSGTGITPAPAPRNGSSGWYDLRSVT